MATARLKPIVRSLILSPHLSEASRGRALIAEVAADAGFPEERVFDITVACSEAIANAIEHSPIKGEIQVRTVLYPDRLEVEVQGPGEFQAPDRLKKRENRGLGLPLMAKLSDHLALYSSLVGRTLVTLAFYRPGATPQANEEPLPPSVRELIESSGLVSAVIDAAPVGMYLLGPDLRFRWANRAWRDFLDPGFHSVDLTGLHYAEVVPEAGNAGLLDILRDISETGTTHTTEEFEFLGFERGVTHWRWQAFPLVEEDEGPPYSVVAVVSEVTEIKRAKEALRESEEQFRVLTDNLQSGVALVDENGKITICNKAFLRLFDLNEDEDILNINSRDWRQWQVFEESNRLLDVDEHPVRKAMRTRTAVRDVLVALQCPGRSERKWVLISAEPILVEQGDVQRLICTYHDITERKQAEEALRASHERLQKVLEIETVGVMFWDLSTGCLVDANDTFLRMMGYSRADVEARDLSWQKFTPPEYHDVSLEEIRKFQATGRVGPYEKEYFRKDGTRQWMVFAGSSLGGNACVEFCVDISERKTAEVAVQQERDRLSALVASMHDEVWFADTQKRFTLVNPEAVKQFGLAPDESVDVQELAASLEVLRPDGSARPVEEAPALRALKGEIVTKEDEIIRIPAAGELRHRQVNATPVKDKFGQIIGSVAVVRDITEQKQAEEALRESEQKYRTLFDSLDQGYFVIDVVFGENDRPIDLYYAEANAAATRMLGRDWTGKRLSEIGEGYEPYWFEIFGRVAVTGESVREQRYAAPDDKWWDFYVFKLGGPESRRIGNTFLDITERKRAEEALRASKSKAREQRQELEQIYGSAPVALALLDSDLRYLHLNERLAEINGLPVADHIGRTIREVVPALADQAEARLLPIFDTGQAIIDLELVGETAAQPGVERAWLERWSPILGEDGRVKYLSAVVLEITERKRAEEQLRRSHDTFARLIENNPMGIYVVDADMKMRNASLGAQHALRNVAPPLIGTGVDVCLRTIWPEPFASEAIDQFRHTLETGEPYVATDMVERRDDVGQVEAYDWRLERIELPDGRFGVVCYYYDLTERKQWELKLKESEERHRSLAEENERLYRQQLDIAETLQLALLNIPSEIGPMRIGHLYRSATRAAQVGGDFYDVFEVRGNKVAILIGDVAGRGIEAARAATLVKDVVHAFVHESLRPHQVLKRTNALLVEKAFPGFVTAFLAVIDLATGLLGFASAGHPEGLLRRASGEIQVLGSGSLPLGVYAGATWKAGEVQLEVGDLLLLYTDGVIEARRDGEFFGQKRLKKLLSRKRVTVERLPHLILDQVLAFSEGTMSDDVAVLALSLAEKPGYTRRGSVQQTLLG